MIKNEDIKVKTLDRSSNIDISKLKIDVIECSTKLIPPIFENYVREQKKDEWEYFIDEG